MLKLKKPRGRGFTLAEIMIVLTVIGVLSAILLPVASNSMPDKNVMKFKKTHNLLMTAFRDLASNGEYFVPGDFSLRPDGTKADGWTACGVQQEYYIDALADTLNSSGAISYASPMTVNQSDIILWSSMVGIVAERLIYDDDGTYMSDIMHNSSSNISDGYNSYFKLSNGVCIGHTHPGAQLSGNDYIGFVVDLDCEKDEIRAFSYFLRKDGKVATDARVNWWLQRDIVKKEDECCPKKLVELSYTGTFEYCDGLSTVCAE